MSISSSNRVIQRTGAQCSLFTQGQVAQSESSRILLIAANGLGFTLLLQYLMCHHENLRCTSGENGHDSRRNDA
jgi:hypothetical protein